MMRNGSGAAYVFSAYRRHVEPPGVYQDRNAEQGDSWGVPWP